MLPVAIYKSEIQLLTSEGL